MLRWFGHPYAYVTILRSVVERISLPPASQTTIRQLSALSAFALWAILTLAAALYATWAGYGGRTFAGLLTAGGFLFLVMLVFAARGAPEAITTRVGSGSGYLLGAAAFFAYLTYAIATETFSYARVGAVAAFVFVLLALSGSAESAAADAWQDFVVLAAIWVAVKFGPTHWLWPYPGGHLAYVLTVLLALSVALAIFLLVRRLPNVGYTIGWGRNWALYVIGSFVALACIVIPLGMRMHFIAYDPHWYRWKAFPFTALGILIFTAWPEEFLFRGLLQNLLSRASKSDLAGWWIASILFGFSHITNLGFPNWKYVLLASIAGIFYGWTWRKSGSIFASALVHAAVDATWHFFFRTL